MAKVPLNHCSFEDLLAIPGATPGRIGCLWALRAQCGEVTRELFEASPHYEEVKDLQGSLDFRPRAVFGRCPSRGIFAVAVPIRHFLSSCLLIHINTHFFYFLVQITLYCTIILCNVCLF